MSMQSEGKPIPYLHGCLHKGTSGLVVKEDISQSTNLYGVVQKVKFDGQEGISQPDVVLKVQAELKLFRQLIFTYYKGCSIYQVLSKLICHGDIAAAFTNLSK